ncbi:FAD-dependent oxidoreductase [Pseudoalteromonas sp. M8]|uniref:FAD-dependent oxidoreductase n=1 Tax=Pseudoalteromonas sp. M8 TaxID=2692624 RepID=UPI001BA892F2|nr:FAD-dependent oxidoreductase [Pseudoalteromonas sp. M8]QUI70388.1 NAD(P)-binding protein [Pseudoalteromonas sp. M8]
MQKQNVVVVGGGLSGLFAVNKLAKNKNLNITLIEGSPSCGGLLNCFQSESGVYYDQGTHFASKTGVDSIDDILFDETDFENNWYQFSYLNSGNFAFNKWTFDTQVVDIRNLPDCEYHKALGQLISAETITTSDTFSEYAKSHLGEYLYHELFKPTVYKLYGDDVDLLSIQPRVGYFGLNRVVALDDITTESLKKIPKYDEKLAYSSSKYYSEKITTQECYLYPKDKKGIQFWIDKMHERAVKNGVNILTSTEIKKLDVSKKKVTSIITSDGKIYSSDLVIWTVPPSILLKLSNIECSFSYKPLLRTANLFHYSFDKPLFNCKNHYVWNWDKNYRSFRLTFYNNFTGCTAHDSRVTVEVLSSPEESQRISSEEILKELRDMEIIGEEHHLTDESKQVIHSTFPVPDKKLQKLSNEIRGKVEAELENVIIAGRHSGSVWLQSDVIKAINHEIEARIF